MGFGRGLLFTFCASFLIACSAGEDITFGASGVECRVLGQSGKIMMQLVGNNTDGNFSKTNEDRLTFEVDEIKEVDSQGNVVGKSGPKKHAINSLASQSFTFTKVDNVSYYQGIKVINVNLTAFLDGPKANLYVMIYLFLESGNVTFGNESFLVYKGTLKFNIKITDWEFCDESLGNCGQGNKKETGAFIDLTLQIKSKGSPKKESKEEREKSKRKPICHKKSAECPPVYDLGGGSIMVLNKGIEVDGEFVEMPDPFPSFNVKGNKKLFSFRIPKFNSTVLIDPTNSLGGSEGGGDAESGGDTNPDPDSTTEKPASNASLLPFNICALAFLLHVAAMFTVPFNI